MMVLYRSLRLFYKLIKFIYIELTLSINLGLSSFEYNLSSIFSQ